MTREEAKRFWLIRYENAKDFDDSNWETQERKEHREYVEALRIAIEALSADRTGHWIDTYGDEWVCSNCGVATHASEDYHSNDVRAYKMNFCHYCGADMRGE